jgi:hypothetical protein
MADTGITTSYTSAGDVGTGGMGYSGSRSMETGMETGGSELEYSGSRGMETGMETGGMGHSSTGSGIGGGVATLRKVVPLAVIAPPVLDHVGFSYAGAAGQGLVSVCGYLGARRSCVLCCVLSPLDVCSRVAWTTSTGTGSMASPPRCATARQTP